MEGLREEVPTEGAPIMNALSTRLTARFGSQYPFACAGMAFAGETADLAAAVTNAGGIGAVGVGFTPAEKLRKIIREVRDRTGGQPFNINLISSSTTPNRSRSAPRSRYRSRRSTGGTPRQINFNGCTRPGCRCGSR